MPGKSVSFSFLAEDHVSETLRKVGTNASELKARLDKLAAKSTNFKIDADDKDAQAKIASVQAQLAAVGKKVSSPRIDATGMLQAEARIAAIDAQLDALDRKNVTASVSVKGNAAQDIDRITSAALALAPALGVAGAAGVGAGVGVAGAAAAAGLGLAAFIAPAAKTAQQIAAVSSASKTNSDALDGLAGSQKAAVVSYQKLAGAASDYQKSLNPTVYAALAKGEGLAESGLHLLQPVAKATGSALVGLEGDAKKALDTKFYGQFFGYLQNEAPRAVTSFGKSLGNFGTGAAGLLEAFQPVEDDIESGLEHLSEKAAAFGKGANSNAGLQSFIGFVQDEGPRVVDIVEQIGTAFGTVARDALPLGKAELIIVDDTLKLVNAVAQANPLLVTLGLGLVTASKVGKAVGLTSAASGLVGIGRGTKSAADEFPRLTSLGGKAGTVLGAFGKVLGLTGPEGKIAGAGLIVAGAGVAYLTGKLITAKSSAQQFYDAEAAQYKATGNNVSGYQKLGDHLGTLRSQQQKLITQYAQQRQASQTLQSENGAQAQSLNNVTGASDKLALQTAATKQKLADVNQAISTNQKKYTTLTGNLGQVAAATGLSRTASDKLATSLNINLSKNAGVTSKQMARLVNQNIANRDAALNSVSPTDRLAASNEILGDKSASTAEKIQALNSQIADEHQQAIDATTESAQFGDTLQTLSGVLGKNTTRAQATAAAHRVLSGDVSGAGAKTRQLAEVLGQASSGFKTYATNSLAGAHTSKQLSAATATLNSRHTTLVKRLEVTLEKMGISSSAAHQLAEKYLAIPKSASTKVTQPGMATALANAKALKTKLDALDGNYKINLNGTIYDSSGHVVSWTGGQAITGPTNIQHHGGAHGLYTGSSGTRNVDTIPAMLAPNEFVVQSSAVDKVGVPAMAALNAGRATVVPGFAAGGLVSAVNLNVPNWPIDSRLSTAMGTAIASQMVPAAQKAAAASSIISTATGDMGAHSTSAAAAQAYAKSILGQFGWSAGQFPSLVSLWNGESGWNNLAQNPTSTAFGIAQFLNSTWAGKRYPKTTNADQQVYDGFQYISGSYDNPQNAYDKWLSRSPHWYSHGGLVQKLGRLGNAVAAATRTTPIGLKGYASGGYISPGEVAVVGEGGNPEIVQGGRAGATVTPVRGRAAGVGGVSGADYATMRRAFEDALDGAELTLHQKSGRVVASLAANPMNRRLAGVGL